MLASGNEDMERPYVHFRQYSRTRSRIHGPKKNEMGLSCRCQTLPKGSPEHPCAKCKARNKTRSAKAQASGAHLKGVQKYRGMG